MADRMRREDVGIFMASLAESPSLACIVRLRLEEPDNEAKAAWRGSCGRVQQDAADGCKMNAYTNATQADRGVDRRRGIQLRRRMADQP